MKRFNFISGWLIDLRFSLRILCKQPESTLIAVLAMAIAIGTASTMFGVFNSILLESIAFKDPDRLVAIWQIDPTKPDVWRPAAAGNFSDWRRLSRSFGNIASVVNTSFTLTSFEEPDTPLMQKISYGYFEVLGVEPLLGRTFRREDDQPGKRFILLSYQLWQNRFNGNQNIIGQTTELDRQPYEIIGVMPANFDNTMLGLTERPMAWLPMALTETGLDRQSNDHIVIARLGKDVSLTQARQELLQISHELSKQYPDTNKNVEALVTPINENTIRRLRTSIFLLLGAVLLVLVIASSNVVNLLLARLITRYNEFAIRRALGASNIHLFRQSFIENLIIMIFCGGFGLLLVLASNKLVNLLIPIGFNIPKINITINYKIVIFTLIISFLPGLVFSLLPIFYIRYTNITAGLNITSNRVTGNRKLLLLQRWLVITEISLSLILLIGAGLMVKSFLNLQQLDQGFDPQNLLTFRVSTRGADYKEDQSRQQFFHKVLERLETIPGVDSVGAAQIHPFSPQFGNSIVILDGQPVPAPGREPRVTFIRSTAGYFNTMRIPILQGRLFTDSEDNNSQPVCIISSRMAKQFWGDKDPIGERLTIKTTRPVSRQIIGIVGDIRTDSFPPDPQPIIYVPMMQDIAPTSISYVLRTNTVVSGLRERSAFNER